MGVNMNNTRSIIHGEKIAIKVTAEEFGRKYVTDTHVTQVETEFYINYSEIEWNALKPHKLLKDVLLSINLKCDPFISVNGLHAKGL